MASSGSECGVCAHRNITKPSVVWCSECEEGLCEDCREHHSFSKATRNHEIVPVDDYMKQPANILQIAQVCNKHNEKYELFCRKHDCPCCRKCVEDHNGCPYLTDIRNMIHNVKSSTAFQAIEQTLSETAENIKKVRINREENLASLTEKRKIVELEIQQFRNKINDNLDKLQDNILKEIQAVEEKESSKIRQLLTSLMQREKEVSEYKVYIENTKRYASNLQSFIAMKQIEKDIIKDERYILSISKSEQMQQIDISWTIDRVLEELTTPLKTFGKVHVGSSACGVSIQNKRNMQAQISVPPSANQFDRTSLKLIQRIQGIHKYSYFRGCTFLPDGKLVLACVMNKQVRVVNPDGTKHFDLKLPVWDVVYIGDNAVAVTSGREQAPNLIRIFDVKNGKVMKRLNVNSNNNGVTLNDGRLIYIAGDKEIKMVSLSDESITSITTSEMSRNGNVASLGNKLFYTNHKNDNVTCCDFGGNTLWIFRESSALSGPIGISVDNDGNVYVTGANSHSVVVISPDGQRYRQLLSKKDGLEIPTAVEYDRSNNKLLVTDMKGNASVYDVVPG